MRSGIVPQRKIRYMLDPLFLLRFALGRRNHRDSVRAFEIIVSESLSFVTVIVLASTRGRYMHKELHDFALLDDRRFAS